MRSGPPRPQCDPRGVRPCGRAERLLSAIPDALSRSRGALGIVSKVLRSFYRHRWSSNWICCIDGNPSRNYPETEEKKKRRKREEKEKREGGEKHSPPRKPTDSG